LVPDAAANAGFLSTDPTHGSIQFTYPAEGTISTVLQCGTDRLRILAMNETLADRTWPITFSSGTELIAGPDYVGETHTEGSHKVYHFEFTSSVPGAVVDYTPDLTQKKLTFDSAGEFYPTAPILTNWQQKTVDEPAPAYDDSKWTKSVDPLYMGADGDNSAYAWYRTTFTSQGTIASTLIPATIRDRMIVFVDGSRIPADAVTDHSATLAIAPGQHTLAILAAHYGRTKLIGVDGPIDQVDAKGLGAPVILTDTPNIKLTTWQHLPTVTAKPDTTTPPLSSDTNWAPIDLGTDVFNHQPGWDWYQTIIPAQTVAADDTSVSIHFDSVDDNATVYCNGKLVGSHSGWNSAFALDLSAAWLPGQPNVISVLDENTDNTGDISGDVTITAANAAGTLHGWKLRGGVGAPTGISGWKALSPGTLPAPPTFYQARFTDTPPQEGGPAPMLRVHLGGMSAGFVWLNGHNLGRYPEKVPVDGIYLPECWINKGDNTLAIFDEDGKQPTKVELYTEIIASRYTYSVTD